MALMQVYQHFHEVGHGTFFTGFVEDYFGEISKFSWVYDCGSARSTQISKAIEKVECWSDWPKKIDLFVLSHFDNDHVNGVEQFLRTHSVRYLALPYLDIAQRLQKAASINSDPCSSSTALFQLDPVQWLHSRGLIDRIDSILFVRGGREGDDPVPNDGPAQPLPEGPRPEGESAHPSNHKEGDVLESKDSMAGKTGKVSAPTLIYWQHTRSIAAAQFPIEFVFFNSDQHDLFRQSGTGGRVARRSGASIAVLQEEVNTIVSRYRLANRSSPARRGWRDKLRKIYDHHFGNSSQARNNISLCLLVRPLVETTCLHPFAYPWPNIQQVCPMHRAGLLCLGDLAIDMKVIAAMKKHFGKIRWDSLFAVQIPHHGSRHSWVAGNANAFSPECFVHCVPDDSIHHPHDEVEQDLVDFLVLRADYRHSVALPYQSI